MRDTKISELTMKCEALKLDLVDMKNKQLCLESLHSYAIYCVNISSK